MLVQTFTYQWSAFSQHFSTNSTYSADNLLTRLNGYIYSTIHKLKNIVWWSSWVQINPYISRPFLDHMSSAPCALPLSPSRGTALAGLYPQLRLSFQSLCVILLSTACCLLAFLRGLHPLTALFCLLKEKSLLWTFHLIPVNDDVWVPPLSSTLKHMYHA